MTNSASVITLWVMKRVEIRELEYFLAVADTLHFARAADQLGIAPPPLSRAIAHLERRLGVGLFERTSRSVQLTAAGRVFRTEARATLRCLDRAVARAQQVGEGAIRIATPPGTGAGLLRELVRAYLGRYGRDTIELVFTREQTSTVRDGRADLALVCSAGDDLTGLDSRIVATEHPVALISAEHPLARQSVLSRDRLVKEPAYVADLPPVGFDALIDLVATGQLIAVVGDSAADRLGLHVAAVPIVGMPPIEVRLAWPTDSRDHRIANLLALESTSNEGFTQRC